MRVCITLGYPERKYVLPSMSDEESSRLMTLLGSSALLQEKMIGGDYTKKVYVMNKVEGMDIKLLDDDDVLTKGQFNEQHAKELELQSKKLQEQANKSRQEKE